MRKRTKFKSPVLDFFVVVFTLSVAGYFGYTFWKDLNSSSRRTDKEKIATITFKNRIAQRKYEDRVVWERIDKTTPLYNGDLIRTAELAEAIITFNDGSQVDISENTMIQVYYSENEGVKISLDSGNLQFDSSNTGKVQLTLGDGSTVSAAGGTSLSTKSVSGASGLSTVAVRNGSATVTGASGSTEAITSGETLSVKNGGEIKKAPVTVVSIPTELKVLNIEGDEVPVKLEWNKTNAKEPVVIQTSTKKDFSVIVEEQVVDSANDSLIKLSEGTLYWRVFPQGKESEASEGKISVAEAKPLTLISPSNESTFQFRNRNPVLNFRWNGNDYASNYLLRVSSTPDMKNPVAEVTSMTPYVQLDSIGNGQWWWQVTPFYELNALGYADAGASAIASFTIEKSSGINPPSLTVPLQNAEIHYKDSLDVNFSWKSDIKASYELIIAADQDFTDVITRKKTAGQRATVSLIKPDKDGTEYYWKVIRNSSDIDDLSPESDIRSFSVSKYVSIPTKLLYPPEEYSVESSKLAATRFIWKPSDEAKTRDSTIQVSASADFSSLQLEKTVSGTTYENMKLPQGNWYWRVVTQGPDGKLEYTQPNHLEVLKELTAPKITNIKNNAEILVAKNSAFNISWTPVDGADCYNIKIFDSNNKLVAEKPEAEGSSAAFVLPNSSYTVKLQAVSVQTESSPIRTGPVEALDFSIRYPEAITLLAPAASAKIDGLTALRNPVNFSWKTGQDKPATTELVIRKRQDDGSFRTVERIKASKTSASVSRLLTGSYTWQIIASTKEGIPLNSEPLAFTVTNVEDLKQPKLTSPEKNFVMDAKYLRKNRTISFEWQAVEGATEYSFVLYKKEKNGNLSPVYSEKNIKGTKLRFKKLASLDLGDFEWNVTAFSYARDGYEERRSSAAKGNFKIKFDAPKQITTEKTERMYSEE